MQFVVLEARALLEHLRAQAAELIALTRACVLAECHAAASYTELHIFSQSSVCNRSDPERKRVSSVSGTQNSTTGTSFGPSACSRNLPQRQQKYSTKPTREILLI